MESNGIEWNEIELNCIESNSCQVGGDWDHRAEKPKKMLQPFAIGPIISQDSFELQVVESQPKMTSTKIGMYWLMKLEIPDWPLGLRCSWIQGTLSLCLSSMFGSHNTMRDNHWQHWIHTVLLSCLSGKPIFPKNSIRKILRRALVGQPGSWTHHRTNYCSQKEEVVWLSIHVHSCGWPELGSAQPSHMKSTPHHPRKRSLDSRRRKLGSFQQEHISEFHFSDFSHRCRGPHWTPLFQHLLEIQTPPFLGLAKCICLRSLSSI